VLVTLDLDFSDITAFPPEEYAGIIVLRVRSQSRHIVSIFQAVLPLLETEPLDGNLWIVEEHRVRVWHRW
jgi:predicted nuclease of predicted toxin-antitoxin system